MSLSESPQFNYTFISAKPVEWSDNIGGGETIKAFTDISFIDETGTEMTERMLVKNYLYRRTLEEAREAAKLDFARYIDLKQLGIPVPEKAIMFETEEGPQIAFSDLTENGKNTVWSFSNISGPFIPMRIKQSNLITFERTIEQIVLAITESEKNYKFAAHAYFVVGNSDDGYRLIVGDFGDSIYEVDVVSEREKLTRQSYIDLKSILSGYATIIDDRESL